MTINLKALYGNNWQEQAERYEKIREGFQETFGGSQDAAFFSAPGRTEIGGNHTDHNHGRVLAAAIDLDIVGMARKTDTGVVRLRSVEYPRLDTVDLNDLDPRWESSGSQALIRGICARCQKLGYQTGGFDCYTQTRVLKGSGLSSSAAFEILVVTVVSHLYNDGAIDPVTAAQIAQYAENVYFGKPSGLLDQMAASVGSVTAIDFADPAEPVIERVGFDLNAYGHALCVVDTGGSHADLTSDYASIPPEMKAVAAFWGKEFLREVDETVFYDQLGEVRKAVGDRAVLRAMHFFDDDRLAHEEAEALKVGNFSGFLEMVRASGKSSVQRLQNVYSPANPIEQGITLAVSLSERLLGRHGASRVHGGGFAGTIQAYVPFDMLDQYRAGMERVFGPGSCYVLSVRGAGGTKVER
ncbi:galactokinase [Acutalibacter sp. 1XD8-33]|uniref:galactokinase n=1 Tax=Acutalibacter sp. 1XD8-33 TaxID=2320081 RepID=UPI001FAA64D5|nr:galactokinase family protein [Acutalibacter sp. 1XD8-33]